MNLNPLKKHQHSFEFESPYTIEKINYILKRNVYQDNIHRLYSPAWRLYVDEKPFVGTYNDQGFTVVVNPKKPSGLTSRGEPTGTISGYYTTNHETTTIHVIIADDPGGRIALMIMFSFVLLFWLTGLFTFNLLMFCASSFFLTIVLVLCNLFSYYARKAEAKLRELLG